MHFFHLLEFSQLVGDPTEEGEMGETINQCLRVNGVFSSAR